MLKIAQVLNNNVALVDLDNQRQAVVKGKGIAFQKQRGDSIEASNVEKLFYLETETSRQNLYFLLKDIPIDVVTTTYEIIDVARRKYHINVVDYIYITLSDHVFGAYKRFREGTYLDSLVPDLHEQYLNEYAAAYTALSIINNDLGVGFPRSEAKNIALHFINAIGQSSEEQRFGEAKEATVSDLVQEVLKRHGILRSTSNGNYYDRFMIHLQYLVDRLQHSDKDATVIKPRIVAELEGSYPRSYEIASEIFDEIRKNIYPEMSEDERLYFVIHIQRLITESPIGNG
ncbi:transcription antiterminator LacT [Lacticaseibacillus pantheris]|uniref:transcription antiterminator LacT n=1 Tax=Lacticaseibacillus pantheris TaxID=171523 RepID=UPI00265A1318|nr:transcription antiterminator LacT [Lacticaseibacillus pantheris]WKF85811.1 transcription antiterminator LacT [Lacticaseibacillus pantheris]